jgi:hypothetical protein
MKPFMVTRLQELACRLKGGSQISWMPFWGSLGHGHCVLHCRESWSGLPTDSGHKWKILRPWVAGALEHKYEAWETSGRLTAFIASKVVYGCWYYWSIKGNRSAVPWPLSDFGSSSPIQTTKATKLNSLDLPKKNKVAQTYNSSYLGGGSWRPATMPVSTNKPGMAAHTYGPSHWEIRGRRIMI